MHLQTWHRRLTDLLLFDSTGSNRVDSVALQHMALCYFRIKISSSKTFNHSLQMS